MALTTYRADWIYTPDGWLENAELSIDGDGRIETVSAGSENRPADSDLGAVALLPGFVNSHSHAFQYGMRADFHETEDFNSWVRDLLYPFIENLSVDDVVRISRDCFREMVRNGITTVGEFHYVHNAPDGTRLGTELDQQIIQAARDVGLRIGLLRTFYDVEGLPGRRRFLESPEEAEQNFRQLAEVFSDDSLVNLMPAPHSVHGASSEMIKRAVALSNEYDCPMHIHLCERADEVDECIATHGVRPMKLLENLGAVNPHMVAIHCVWLNDAEVEQLATQTGGQVSCPTTNLQLGDGTSPLGRLINHGGSFSLGSDANQRIDPLEDARIAEHLQRIARFEMKGLETGPKGTLLPTLLHHLTEAGAKHLGFNDVGRLEPGQMADFITIPVDRLQFRSPDGSPSLEEMILCRSACDLVQAVYVAGNKIHSV